MANKKDLVIFIALVQKARRTKDKGDIKEALYFGMDKRIPNNTIREYMGII